MKFLAVAVFFVAVACASAGGIGLPLAVSRGALEGALGGQWIPDVPVRAAAIAAPIAAPLAAPWGAPWGAPVLAGPGLGLGLGWGAPAVGVVSAKGALEGALGGQWIPDVPAH